MTFSVVPGQGEEAAACLAAGDFRQLSRFIHAEFGLNITEAKKGMIEARLRKRLRILGMGTFAEYCAYLFSPAGMRDEMDSFLDEITTNKTEFFRQPDQFSYLRDTVLPLLQQGAAGRSQPLRVWSAACSSGEEPYSIAMTLDDYAASHAGQQFSVLGTDLSPAVLAAARTAVYSEAAVESVPAVMKRRYFLRSRDRSRRQLRIIPELRARVTLQQRNLLSADFPPDHRFDIIFCRNVIIYFDRPTQERLLRRLCGQLVPGGWLFTGNAETTNGMNLPLTAKAPSVYRTVHP